MLKNFKPVGLLLLAGTLGIPGYASADTVTAGPRTSISQQDGKSYGNKLRMNSVPLPEHL